VLSMLVRRALALLSLAAATAVPVAVSGCGSSSVSGVVDPVARAATVSDQTSGMRVNVAMRLTASALPAPIAGSGNGTFNLASHSGSFDFTLDLGSIPQVAALLGTSKVRIDEILEGSTIYLKLPPALNRSPALHGKPWMKVNVGDAARAAGLSGFSSLLNNPAASDPTQLLRYLRATSGGVTKLGTATVDGFQTTHYRARIQLDRVPDAFPPSARAQVRQTVAALEQVTHVHSIPVDVWIDGQHLVRRENLSLDLGVAGQSVTAAIRVDIPSYGPQPAPQLPPASQVADLTGMAAR